MIIRPLVFITLLITVSVNNGFCEIYKWKNDDGSISYTDDLDRIPKEYIDKFETMNLENDQSVTIQNESDTEDVKDIEEKLDELSQKELTKTDADTVAVSKRDENDTIRIDTNVLTDEDIGENQEEISEEENTKTEEETSDVLE